MFRSLLRIVLLVVLLLTIIEAMSFVLVRPDRAGLETAQLLVIFKGPGASLIAEAYLLLDQGVASHFCIPGLSEKAMAYQAKKYDLPEGVTHERADVYTKSTFEDALQAGAVIRRQGYGDVLLVVSDFHVVRSWLLLKAETMGTGCRLRVIGITEKRNFRQQAEVWYSEAVKFWGSALEFIYCHLTGKLLTANPRIDHFLESLKRVMLLDS